MDISNDIAAGFTFRVVRGYALGQYFDLAEDGQPMDLTGATVIQNVVNSVGKVVASFSLGDGYSIVAPNRLLFRKEATEKNIAAGNYQTELKITLPGRDPIPLYRGPYISINSLIPVA
jgi:hypothetical protein